VSAFRRVLISGVGLIGGSWALGLRRAGFRGVVLGFDKPEALDRVEALGIVDEVRAGLPDDVRDGDLVVLATPVGATVELLSGWARAIPAGAVVTDTGSTKRAVCDAARGLASAFVGGHPMAGSERSGVDAARADLFDGATWFLVAGEGQARDNVADMVGSLGARPVVVDAAEHDRRVALGSHLPQLASSALASVLVNRSEPPAGGPGLAAMTRLAASPWSVWGDILRTNRDALAEPLDAFIAALGAARAALDEGDDAALEALFRRANLFRDERD
jgi:prephenate dehydrogenase